MQGFEHVSPFLLPLLRILWHFLDFNTLEGGQLTP